MTFFAILSRKRDSNPRPTHYECVALPTELFRPVISPVLGLAENAVAKVGYFALTAK